MQFNGHVIKDIHRPTEYRGMIGLYLFLGSEFRRQSAINITLIIFPFFRCVALSLTSV